MLEIHIMGKYATHYTDEELKAIKEQWFANKKRVDEEHEGSYHWDKDKEYEKYFSNARLRKLFHHAAFLYRGMNEAGFNIHPNEKPLIAEVYRRMLADGYYTKSKIREKEVSAHFGKAVSRQYRPKNK